MKTAMFSLEICITVFDIDIQMKNSVFRSYPQSIVIWECPNLWKCEYLPQASIRLISLAWHKRTSQLIPLEFSQRMKWKKVMKKWQTPAEQDEHGLILPSLHCFTKQFDFQVTTECWKFTMQIELNFNLSFNLSQSFTIKAPELNFIQLHSSHISQNCKFVQILGASLYLESVRKLDFIATSEWLADLVRIIKRLIDLLTKKPKSEAYFVSMGKFPSQSLLHNFCN